MKIPSANKIAEAVGSSFAGKVGKAVGTAVETLGSDAERVLLSKRKFKMSNDDAKEFFGDKMTRSEISDLFGKSHEEQKKILQGKNFSEGEIDSLMKMETEHENSLHGFKLSKTGWGILAGAGTLSSMNNAYNTYNENRMGTPTEVATSTPELSYAGEFGGTMAQKCNAGGDLVFALNRNR